MQIINRDRQGKRSLDVYIHWFLVLIYALAFFTYLITMVIDYYYDTDYNKNSNLIKFAVIFGSIFVVWIFLRKKKRRRFYNKLMGIYTNKNKKIEFTFEDIVIRLKINKSKECLYVFENDNTGNIIKLPFNKIVSYKIYEQDYFGQNDYFTRVLEIKTSLNNPNYSIIKLYYNEGDVQAVEEARKLLVYAMTRSKKITE